jgi:hypothetical protein
VAAIGLDDRAHHSGRGRSRSCPTSRLADVQDGEPGLGPAQDAPPDLDGRLQRVLESIDPTPDYDVADPVYEA